jgi:GST-like protein
MNKPTAGAREEKALPVGDHPFQLYSLATPNGQKVTILFEEIRAAQQENKVEYDAWLINIMQLTHFTSGFVEVNPNSKIPALYDQEEKIRVFESGHICHYLASKFNMFLGSDRKTQVECMNWVHWLQGSAPYLGGGYGHFYAYAPVKIQYCIDRFTMEAKRQMDVLNQRLANNTYLAGEEYTIADMCTFPWYGNLALGLLYGESKTFLDVEASYPHVVRWANLIFARPAVQRGRLVNRIWGDDPVKVPERHSDADFDEWRNSELGRKFQ